MALLNIGSSVPTRWPQASPCYSKSVRRRAVVATIEICKPDDFEVGRLLGTFGYMNVTSYIPPPQMGSTEPLGLDQWELERRMGGQEVGQGGVQVRLYTGRFTRGPRRGTRVVLKAYPGRNAGSAEADAMAANELATHAVIQETSDAGGCPNVTRLLGGFQTQTGEQWLVFRDDGQSTAADYAKAAGISTTERRAVGDWEFLDYFDYSRPIKRRYIFIIKLLRGAFSGLAHMHSNGRLHQSLGPSSVVINTLAEKDAYSLVPQLRDMAFSVDISDEAIFRSHRSGLPWKQKLIDGRADDLSVGSATAALSEGLWRRARAAGALTPFEQKAFGISDDIYAAGLLMAYMIFVSFCKAGSIDGPSLQRLFETTFRLDLQAAREYCLADDNWVEAIKFLDLGEGAGWELLQAMLNADYRQRPIAEAVLNHRFMTGALLF
ncbi:hypothetical protein GOP47_0000858 [Adiantum capillus-veneris]|uniref:Protein kinase domain-containing protein n=1 Tax=Adiantum capillus-veneris TaxID=13818 RepID=A0A9D4VE32_ADICA|nr:hypothetical protein GOP47_0000858 [Adiantum capillus-veneris]